MFHKKLHASSTDLSASVRLLSAAHGELQYLRDSWDSVLLSANAMSSTWGIKPEFTDKRQRRTNKISWRVVKWLQTYWSHAGLQGGCVLQGCWRGHKPASCDLKDSGRLLGYSSFSFQTLCWKYLMQSWKPKPKTCKRRTRLIWKKILFQKLDHSDVNSARKLRTVSQWNLFWLYCCRLTLCCQSRNLELRVFCCLHCQSRSQVRNAASQSWNW